MTFTNRRPGAPALLRALGGALLALLASLAPLGAQAASPAPAAPAPVPESLSSAVWMRHLTRDLLPFWSSPEALGSPVGNFPTVRTRTGALAPETARWPRMLGRQTFVYALAYLATGEPQYLDWARAGVRWLIDKAWDHERGGWHARLTQAGEPDGAGDRSAQDSAYAAMGLAAYFFVTRDPEAERYLIKTRDLMFDPAYYWDAENRRVKDALDAAMSRERDQEGGGWELVALLDQINAYMLLVQPVLTRAEDRAQWAADLNTLGDSLVEHFWSEGIFFGQKTRVGRFGGRHTDVGHNFKSYWMLYGIDRRLGQSRYTRFVDWGVRPWIPQVFNAEGGVWSEGLRPWNEGNGEGGASWWGYAEADQLTATFNLIDGRYTPILERTARTWLDNIVDTEYGEIFQGLNAEGRARAPGLESTSKVWEWKNGFHSVEHAVLLWMHGLHLEGRPVPLYFALPAAQAAEAPLRPYLWEGEVLSRTAGRPLSTGLIPVRAEFRLVPGPLPERR